jgi:hypothetical protein
MGPEENDEQVPQGDAQPAGEPTAPAEAQPSPVPVQQTTPAPQPNAQVAALNPTEPDVTAKVQAAKTSHLAGIGQQLLGALGKEANYSIDPKTGQTVTTVSNMKPGELFRRILAGALVGGAVGGQAARAAGGSPLAGAVAGAGAVEQMKGQQDEGRREQAQNQFKNQMTADKNQRDQQETDVNGQLLKAQIAHSNIGTLKLNQETQAQDYDTHQKHAQAGKTNVAPYLDAGLKPTFDQVPEEEMQKTIQSNPGASALDWEPVGMKESVDAQTGEHHYQYVYSAFDPKGKVPLSDVTLNAWKKDGFLDTMGQNAADILQPGKQLDASQYIALKNKHTQYQLQQETDRQKQQKVAMDAADLADKQAQAAQRLGAAHASDAKSHQTARAGRATQTSQAADAASDVSDPNNADDRVGRAAKNIIAGNDTIDTVGKGMGKEASKFRQDVQDRILKLSGGKYDFEGQRQEAKEFNSVPVQTKVKANVTLTGSDGKSGLLSELQQEAHKAGITSLPALNDVQAWGRIQSGSPEGVTLHQLMNDIAEQYGSIFAQGGATSDAKIKLAQENFPKNFNTAQIDEAVRAARIALGDRMRVYADHNRFVRAHFGASIPVRIVDDKGRGGTTTMDKVDDLLAKNKNWKRAN